MNLSDKYILNDGKRLINSIENYPDFRDIFKSTLQLLKLETIELLCLLRHARNYRSDVYKLRILGHKAKEDGGNVEHMQMQSYNDYEEATRKVWVFENIIKDRVGYFPQKINDSFLSTYLERIEQSQTKHMVIKKGIKS